MNDTPVFLSARSARGLTLIELMIALTMGTIIVAAIGSVFLASRQSFRTQEVVSRMQENARYAFELMDRDIRMVGFSGYVACTASECNDVTNTVSPAKWWNQKLLTLPLMGYENALPADMTAGDRLRGDSFSAIRADKATEFNVSSHTPPTITTSINHSFSAGDTLVISGTTNTAVFQASAVTANTITHGEAGISPSNCTSELGAIPLPVNCSNAGSAVTFAANSSVFLLSGNTYYIRNNSGGEPALYRERLQKQTSGGTPTATTVAEELITGVEDMQITYGIDTSVTPDTDVDSYVTANNVTNWARVLGVRISLLMVSRQDEQGITSQFQTYTYNGTTSTAADYRIRKVFTTTIAIRNRL